MQDHADAVCLLVAGQVKSFKGAGHAASAAEDYAASESGEPNSPEHGSRSKGLNPFMSAKLADAVGKGECVFAWQFPMPSLPFCPRLFMLQRG